MTSPAQPSPDPAALVGAAPPPIVSTFDPSTAPDAALASRSVEELFDLSMEARQASVDREIKFRAAMAASRSEKADARLEGSTVLAGRIPVVVYARYSSEGQNPLSIEDQISLCLRYCERMGYEPIAICSDAAMTAQTLIGRVGWAKAMRVVQDGLSSRIVAESLDRVARDPIDLLLVMEELRRTGAALDTPETGKASQLHGLLHAIYNNLFRAGLVQKVLRGMRGAVERGGHPGGTNYGLEKVRGKTEEDDDYFPKESEARLYFRIMYEIGVLKRSYWSIAFDLNSEGIPAPRGGLWSPQNFVHSNGLSGLAPNTRCIGVIQWLKASYNLDRATGKVTVVKHPRHEWVIGYNANHAFIPLWLFERVQAEIAARTLGPSGPRGAAPRRLLTKLLKCEFCGGGMNIYAADQAGRPRVGCSTYKMRGDCGNSRTFYLDTIELMVAETMKDFLATPNQMERHFEVAVEAVQVYRGQLEEELQTKLAERETLRPLTVDLVKKMADAGVDGDKLKKIIENDLAPIYAQQSVLARRIEEIEKLLSSDKLQSKKVDKAADVFADLVKLLKDTGGKGLPTEVIEAAQSIIGKVLLKPDDNSYHFDLTIEGKFDAMVADDLITPLATIHSADYKDDRTGRYRHPTELTGGKRFTLAISSRTLPDTVVEAEVGFRRIKNAGNRSHRNRCLDPRKNEKPTANESDLGAQPHGSDRL